MINEQKLTDLYSEAASTLHKASYDETNDVYMTESGEPAISFDKLKDQYFENLGSNAKDIESADAFFKPEKSNAALIEFKNGRFRPIEIKRKMKDSLLVLCDISDIHISDSRKGLDFILVYNKKLRPENAGSDYRNKVVEYVTAKAGMEFVRFGLNSLKGTLFNDVHTYTQEQFEGYLNRYTERNTDK